MLKETVYEPDVQFERLVNCRVAAPLVGVHYKTLERMARTGEVPAVKMGKCWLFKISLLSQWLDARLESNVTCQTSR
jgi:excisionase family DNA binding protein